jgi:methylenetetrahydrofolate dehydrogenase (NADP+)/methenyltetrahydrofolate cyclohydrolase
MAVRCQSLRYTAAAPQHDTHSERAMPAAIIDGQVIAQQIHDEVRQGVERLRARGVEPGLAVVLVGDNPASVSYVRGKTADAAKLGMRSETIRRPADIAQAELLSLIADLNADPRWHGILVQLPLPPQIDENAVITAIAVDKDVDGLTPANVGRLFRGEPALLPCTPNGVRQMLLRSGHDPAGKHVVICGRSNLVGKPLAGLLMQKAPGGNATVTVCHTMTPDIAVHTRRADILVAVMGRAGAITADMVREGAVVIDVGVNRVADATKKSGGRLVGDVDFAGVAEKAAAITPVPGGVGPMTRAMLLYNTVVAAEGGPR